MHRLPADVASSLLAGFGEGIRGEQIPLSSALGSTTPDVTRDEDHEPEGVCVYLDGLSAHHGNPETATDREIRDWRLDTT